jgi:CRP/FNR family cyclic AMP-dependent transcriptional regulator
MQRGVQRLRAGQWPPDCPSSANTGFSAGWQDEAGVMTQCFHPREGYVALSDALRHHRFTGDLADHHIATLASIAAEVTFAEDELVLLNGQCSRSLYLVTDGSVSVELHTATFTVAIQALGVGQAFGWSSLLEDQDTLFRVRARQRTAALRLDGATLKQACRSDPVLGYEILQRALKLVAGRVQATEEKFAEMCGVRM